MVGIRVVLCWRAWQPKEATFMQQPVDRYSFRRTLACIGPNAIHQSRFPSTDHIHLSIDPADANVAYAAVAVAFGGSGPAGKIYRTTNVGSTWSDITGN